jgi:hypothetical protein
MASFFSFFSFFYILFVGINILVLHDHCHMICNFPRQDYISRDRSRLDLNGTTIFWWAPLALIQIQKNIVSGYLRYEILLPGIKIFFFVPDRDHKT